MSTFLFVTDTKSEEFCRHIAVAMMQLFEISETEAIGRINQQFRGKEWVGEKHVYYHEGVEDWAKSIYYEENTYWWLDSWTSEHTPHPKPFPKE